MSVAAQRLEAAIALKAEQLSRKRIAELERRIRLKNRRLIGARNINHLLRKRIAELEVEIFFLEIAEDLR